jgi:hypothetical protein
MQYSSTRYTCTWYVCTELHMSLVVTHVPLVTDGTKMVQCMAIPGNTIPRYLLVPIPLWYVHVYVRTYNVMSQLSDWKRAHMCTENHVCFGRIHGSQLREGANAGQHTPTLSLPPSHHCLVHVYVRTYQVPLVPKWYCNIATSGTCVLA